MIKIVKKGKIWYYNVEEEVKIMNLTMDMLEYYQKENKDVKNIDLSKHIMIDKDIMNGFPVIKGTRITVKSVCESFRLHFNESSSIKDLIKLIEKDYPSLKQEQILFVLFYYIRHTMKNIM